MTNSRGKRGRALQADGRFAVAMVAAVALLGCAAVLGIVLSLLGGPFFVYLILRRGKGGLNG